MHCLASKKATRSMNPVLANVVVEPAIAGERVCLRRLEVMRGSWFDRCSCGRNHDH